MNRHIESLLEVYSEEEIKEMLDNMLDKVNYKLFTTCFVGLPNMTRLDSVELLVSIQQGLKTMRDEIDK